MGAIGILVREIKDEYGNRMTSEQLETVILEEFNPRCIPPWSLQEIQRAIRRNGPDAGESPAKIFSGYPKPKSISTSEIEANAKDFADRFSAAQESDFLHLSNVKIPDSIIGQRKAFLETLYPKTALLAFAATKSSKDEFLSMTEILGNPQAGSLAVGPECFRVNPFREALSSARANLASFHYCVLESDSCSLESQRGVWLRLIHECFPIVAVTFSGAKSLHAIVHLGTSTLEDFQALETGIHEKLNQLIPGFLDPACKGPERRTRLAGAIRRDKANTAQRLLYLQDIESPDEPF